MGLAEVSITSYRLKDENKQKQVPISRSLQLKCMCSPVGSQAAAFPLLRKLLGEGHAEAKDAAIGSTMDHSTNRQALRTELAISIGRRSYRVQRKEAA